jgi:hypothetical protein
MLKYCTKLAEGFPLGMFQVQLINNCHADTHKRAKYDDNNVDG